MRLRSTPRVRHLCDAPQWQQLPRPRSSAAPASSDGRGSTSTRPGAGSTTTPTTPRSPGSSSSQVVTTGATSNRVYGVKVHAVPAGPAARPARPVRRAAAGACDPAASRGHPRPGLVVEPARTRPTSTGRAIAPEVCRGLRPGPDRRVPGLPGPRERLVGRLPRADRRTSSWRSATRMLDADPQGEIDRVADFLRHPLRSGPSRGRRGRPAARRRHGRVARALPCRDHHPRARLTATQGLGTRHRERCCRRLVSFGGGRGIRTPEGVNPTRFPSERHRPLGDTSAEESTGRFGGR